MIDTGKKSIGIWLRVSTQMQADGDSLEHHEARARAYAESKGWHVADVYKLSGISGKTIIDLPETERMLNDVREGKISALIFSKLARLARNTRELLDIADIFQQHDAGLVSLQESIDTTTAGGRLFFTMLAATTQFERDEIASRVAASVPIRAKMGKHTGGQASFGYAWVDGKLVPDEKEAPIRKLMYELFDKHKRKKKVARILNEMGYRTRKGAKFSDTTVDRLIRDTTAKGVHLRNYTKSQGSHKQWKYKDQKDWIFNEVEPIVPEDLWDRCNSYLKQQRVSRRAVRAKTVKHLFSGLLHCYCGTKMYPYNSASTYTCRSCRNKIGMTVIEDIYQQQLNDFLTSQSDAETFLSNTEKVIKQKEDEVRSLATEQQELGQKIEKLYDLYMNDGITVETFKERHSPLEERVKILSKTVEENTAQIEAIKSKSLSASGIVSYGSSIADNWENLTKEERRELIESITEKIVISEDSIDISFSYAPLINKGKKATHSQTFIAAIN